MSSHAGIENKEKTYTQKIQWRNLVQWLKMCVNYFD